MGGTGNRMVKQLVLILLLMVGIKSFSQMGDENRLLNQFIVMLQPDQNVERLEKEFISLNIKRCLSRQMNIWLVERNATNDAEKFLQTLQASKTIKIAQFNHHVQRRSLVPDDPYFSNQWNMMNTGQGGGVVGADIDATGAWAINHDHITANGDTIVVAVIDGYEGGGFDITHEDINFLVNYHEIPGNGIDDDSDGFVDNYYGWNAFDSSGTVMPFGSSDPHAMHVSGIAAAIGNNEKGVAGVCWGAPIMRIVGGSDVESQVVEAYDYVREMRRLYNLTHGIKGAFVVSTNSSFGLNGGPGGARHVDYPIWCAMYDSMGAVGILSAAATANTAWNIDMEDDMPTGCPSNFLIAVTNTNSNDQLNGSAAWGDTSVDLSAPGTGIFSTETSNSYGQMTGTSMASPHVAGTVAAMYAQACTKMLNDAKVHPDSIALIIKQMILSGTSRLSTLYNRTVSGGRLNLFNAIKNLDEYNCGACNYSVSLNVTQPTCSNSCNGDIQLLITGNSTYSYTWSNGATGVPVIHNLCPGTYSVTVTDLSTNCSQVKNAYLYEPDSIVVSAIHVIPAGPGISGNIIVSASAGNYNLAYSIDGLNYQQPSTLVISTNGTYTVYIKNELGCIVERIIEVSGIASQEAEMKWNVFPNPASQELNISFTLSKGTSVTQTITNILGEQVSAKSYNLEGGMHTLIQNVASLAEGTYFISLSNGALSATQRFVVVR